MPKPFICKKCGFDLELSPRHDCVPVSEISELDALKAQVEQLRGAAQPLINDYFNWMEINDVDIYDLDESYHEVYNMMIALSNSIQATSAQCLAEIRAQAGRDGYLQGCADYGNRLIIAKDEECAEFYAKSADEYASRLREGG